jgi:hypothetical protein
VSACVVIYYLRHLLIKKREKKGKGKEVLKNKRKEPHQKNREKIKQRKERKKIQKCLHLLSPCAELHCCLL